MKDAVVIDGIEYVRKVQIDETKSPYVLIRADRAGVFVGNLISRSGTEVVLSNCRRIFYWDGAASISQLALTGPSKPKNCKFPAPVDNHTVLGVIEILPVTDAAKKAIEAVAVWQA
jgi:hypothetical protein